eukprot:scaffold98006_cov66-Phaeocystis_antarctica.AAC.4
MTDPLTIDKLTHRPPPAMARPAASSALGTRRRWRGAAAARASQSTSTSCKRRTRPLFTSRSSRCCRASRRPS